MTTISIPLYSTEDSWFYTRDWLGDLKSFEILDIAPLIYPVIFEGVEYDAVVLIDDEGFSDAHPIRIRYSDGHELIAKEILWRYYDDDQKESLQKEITPDDIEEFYK